METDNTAVALHRWLTKEMVSHNPYNISPSVEDLKCICKGQYQELWSFFITRVKSAENINHIKSNLRLDSLKNSPISKDLKLVALEQEELALAKEVIHLEKTLEKVQSSCQDLRKRISDTETSSIQLKKGKHNVHQSESMLRLCGENVALQTERYSKLKAGLDVVKDGLLCDEKPDYHSYKLVVTETCKTFEEFLEAGLHGSAGQVNKPQLVQLTQQLMSQGSSTLLLKCLEEHLVANLSQLKLKSQNLDWHKETEALKLKLESDEEYGLKSLQSLLQDLSWIHTKSKLATNKSQKELANLQGKLEQMERIIYLQLEEKAGSEREFLQNARMYISLQLQTSKLEAAIAYLKKSMEEFQLQNASWEEQQNEWQSNLAKVEENTLISDRLALMIKTVAKRNIGLGQRIGDCRDKNFKVLNFDLPGHITGLDLLLAGNENPIASLVQDLSKTPIWHLSPISQTKAIYRFCMPAVSGSNECEADGELRKMLQGLDAQRFLSPERILTVCGNMQLQTRQQKSWHVWHVANMQESSNDWVDSGRLKLQSLERHVNEAWKAQHDELVLVLHSRLGVLRKAEDMLPEIHKALNIWWEQPAQKIVGTKKVQGQDISVWRQKWQSAVAALKTKNKSK